MAIARRSSFRVPKFQLEIMSEPDQTKLGIFAAMILRVESGKITDESM
jgi:hypothetical protein